MVDIWQFLKKRERIEVESFGIKFGFIRMMLPLAQTWTIRQNQLRRRKTAAWRSRSMYGKRGGKRGPTKKEIYLVL